VIWKDQVLLHRYNELVAYAVQDGSRRWWVKAGTQGTGTPAVYGDMAYLNAFGSDPDLRDPIPSWTELVAKFDKNTDSVVDSDEFPTDLAVLRRVDARDTPGAIVTFKRYFAFIDTNKDSKIDQKEWETVVGMIAQTPDVSHGIIAIKLGGENDVSKTNIVWKEPRSVPEVPMALVHKDRVYTISNGGIASILDAKTGALLARGRVGAGGLYYASPIAGGDRIYIASGDGVISVIQAGNKLEVLARNDLGEPIFATPAIVDGKLYVRTTSRLYAFSGE
jgi:hypothetical protein